MADAPRQKKVRRLEHHRQVKAYSARHACGYSRRRTMFSEAALRPVKAAAKEFIR
jgi:hypothetical protein